MFPTHYDFTLKPNIKLKKFAGDISIHITIEKATKVIELHQSGLSFHKCNLTDAVTKKEYDIKTKVMKELSIDFIFEKTIPKGDYVFEINYSGILDKSMSGLYLTTFKQEDGTYKETIVTQFEPTDARKCFPCFDDPDKKSTFNIIVEVDSFYDVLSNMPVLSCEYMSEPKRRWIFEKTPKMSTYLVCIVLGVWDYVEKKTDEGVLVKVYTPKYEKDKGVFALDIACKCLTFFTNWFDIPYPLRKVDLVSIENFSSGAMENWGCITFSDKDLLTDKDKSPMGHKLRIAEVVCHELAHQWFGNLVTMKAWNSLWLNEGFATWMAIFACSYICTDLQSENEWWYSFLMDFQAGAFETDYLRSTHPIHVKIRKELQPGEINELFDAITYEKGACLIHMLVNTIGIDDFQTGIRKYLKQFEYSNATNDDLWNCLGDNIKNIIKEWIEEPGFPIIKISVSENLNFQAKKLKIEQFIAQAISIDKKDTKNKTIWKVPLFVEDELMVMDTKEMDINTEINKPLNLKHGGFYRCLYDEELLLQLLKSDKLDMLDVWGLLNDLLHMTQMGYCKTSFLLDTISTLNLNYNEDNIAVLQQIIVSFGILHVVFDKSTDQYNIIKNKLFDVLTNKVLNSLGLNENINFIHLLEKTKKEKSLIYLNTLELVIGILSKFPDSEFSEIPNNIIRTCIEEFRSKELDEIDSLYRNIVLWVTIKYGEDDDYNKLWNFYSTVEEPIIRLDCIRALCATKEQEKLEAFLNTTLDENKTKAELLYYILASVSSNTLSHTFLLDWFIKNWPFIWKQLGENKMISNVVHCLSAFNDEKSLVRIKSFYKTLSKKEKEWVKSAFYQVFEIIQIFSNWKKRGLD